MLSQMEFLFVVLLPLEVIGPILIGLVYAGNISWAQTVTLEQLETIYYIEQLAKKELVHEKIQKKFSMENKINRKKGEKDV